MSHRRRARRGPVRAAVVAAVAIAATVGMISTAFAATAPAPPGAVGKDVSYPQCGTTLPQSGAFGIVGVNGGRAFSTNPCLASQWAWASGRPNRPGVYVNTGNPAPTSSFYWSASGRRDPALCVDNRSTTDPGCAYNYGWHAAEHALRTGRGVDRAMTRGTWWLDVEVANSWHGDGAANAADLQGALDYLRSHGVRSVGIYSTAHQWKTITGGYSSATAAGYKASWRKAFRPRYALESVPVWVATVEPTASAAERACGASFTGGPVTLVQFRDGSGLDADVVCRAARPRP